MEAEKVNQLLAMSSDKLNDKQIAMLRNKIAELNDDTYPTVAAIMGDLKTPVIALILGLFLMAGEAYIGKISRTVIFWILMIIVCISPVIFLIGIGATSNGVFGIVAAILAVGLGIVLFFWWLFDAIGIMSSTKEVNYKKVLNAIAQLAAAGK